MATPTANKADTLVTLLCSNEVKPAAALLRKEPELARANLYAACATGEVDSVARTLRSNPRLAKARGGPHRWPPLLYACFSGFLRQGGARARALARVVKSLLARGADPNVSYLWGGKHPLSALYGAAGFANSARVTRLLLDAGANPNDGESLYHSAEFKDLTCTRLLLDGGAKIDGTNAVHRKLDFDDLAGLRLFLDHGADANLRGCTGDTLLHQAITNGRSVPFLQLLAERGADLRARTGEGFTAFEQASRLGNVVAARFLTARGAAGPLDAKQQFIAALARGDARAAKAGLKLRPRVMRSLTPADRGLLTSLAWRGNAKAVGLMTATGFDPAALGKHGETALHNASWMGHLATVRVLLKAGAPLEAREPQYDGTPLQWAIHGFHNSRDAAGKPLAPKANHRGVIKALISAGARLTDQMKQELPPDLR